MHHTFPTPGPTSLYVEIDAGITKVHATDTTRTEVLVEGKDADRVLVEQRGDEIVVKAEQRRVGFFGFGNDVTVTVTLPLDSHLTTRLGSADLVATGRYASVHAKCGSGDVSVDEVTGETVILTGSGDVRLAGSEGDLRVKSGSGEVQVGSITSSAVVTSGSGSITVDSTDDETVLKSGSGDVRVGRAEASISLTSGSGDLEVGRVSRGVVRAKTASGDVQVGIPAGIPVWTDISCVTGSIRSDLQGSGEPAEGEDHVEIRASTVSGDVQLNQL